MNLCDTNVIREVLARHGFRFSKSLGQNFLTDESIPKRIAGSSGAQEAGNVLEIGPGMGCLTMELCAISEKVVAVELDQALFPVLEDTLSDYKNWEAVQGDVLALDLKALCFEKFGDQRAVACANLPYYITTPAVTALLECNRFERITLMVQREVAKRICAAPGTPDYSAFTIYVQYWAKPEILFDVPAESFMPRPKVDSSVIRLTPLGSPSVETRDEKLFFSLVRAAFNMRRKTLVNALMPLLGERFGKDGISELLESLGLDVRVRGERLSLEDFAKLSDKVKIRMEGGEINGIQP